MSRQFTRSFKLLVIATCYVFVCGCGTQRTPLTGGKPVSHWVQALHDRQAKVRKEAVFKLGNAGTADAAVLPALIGALQDNDSRVRSEAIMALAKSGSDLKETSAALARAKSSDRDPHVRNLAGKALKKSPESMRTSTVARK